MSSLTLGVGLLRGQLYCTMSLNMVCTKIIGRFHRADVLDIGSFVGLRASSMPSRTQMVISRRIGRIRYIRLISLSVGGKEV